MKMLRVVSILFVCGIVSLSNATDLVIESLDEDGRLIFNELPSALTYRVEQASSPGGSWGLLTNMPPSGTGTITSTIPLTASTSFFRVVAELKGVPEGMGYIPGGIFQMGDTLDEGYPDELPVHGVDVSEFYMDKYEVTNDEMVEVMQWAHDNGKLVVSSISVKNAQGNQQELLDLDDTDCRITWNGSSFSMKSAKGSGYPCVEVSWYGSAAYCNYRSEKEERTPCYDLTDWSCDFSANGYRLPTEAEWEKAARGGLGNRYGCGDSIDYSKANYDNNPTYDIGDYPYTSPVGEFAPNEYGLYDMAGNVWEWCGDWYAGAYYATSPSSNPRGASTGSHRVLRGGPYHEISEECRSARRFGDGPSGSRDDVGFRAVLSAK